MCDWNSGSSPRATRSWESSTSGRMKPSSLSFGQWSVCRATFTGYFAATDRGELRQRDRAGDHVLDAGAGQELGAAGGDLDDAVALGVGEPAQRGVERLARGHVDRRVGEAVLLGPVEHLGVDLGRRDRHGERAPVW